jgi:hypothetical protein
MDKKSLLQLKAFLLANETGEDPKGYIAALERISLTHPSQWNGKLPVSTGFKLDPLICKVTESTKKRPIIPWWWYLDQKEPVPAVAQEIFSTIVFDYVLVFPNKNVWIYVLVEPEKKVLDIIKSQDNLRAFIMMSLLNKNFKPNERETHRLRLGKIIGSPDINKIITFVIHNEDYEFARLIPKQIPSVSREVGSTGTSWRIRYPGKVQPYWSFKELVAALTGAPLQVKRR